MSIYLNPDCAQNGGKVDNHVPDWPFLQKVDHVPAQNRQWRAARSEDALKGTIRKSKTDQYGRGQLVFGSERSAKLLRGWFRKKPKEIEAVFCAINHG